MNYMPFGPECQYNEDFRFLHRLLLHATAWAFYSAFLNGTLRANRRHAEVADHPTYCGAPLFVNMVVPSS